MAENTNNPFTAIDNRLSSIESKLESLAAIQKPPQVEKRYYPVNQAAEKLGVAPITIYRGVDNGTIPGKRVGSRLLIPSSFVDR
jgi:excisionase family DNA binding protein